MSWQLLPNTAQLFTQGVNAKIKGTEELASMNSLCGATTAQKLRKY